MNDELIIQMAITVVLASIKNPDKKAKLRNAMLKIFRTIALAYAGDPDFVTSAVPAPAPAPSVPSHTLTS